MPGELSWVRDKSYSKGKEKRILEKNTSNKTGHNRLEGPQNKHTIEDQGCSWATPSKKVWVLFISWDFDKEVTMLFFGSNELIVFLYVQKHVAKYS